MIEPAKEFARPTDQRSPNLRRSIGWAGALIVFDAFVLNQGFIALLVGTWMVLGALPRAAFSKDPAVRRLRLARVGIFLAAVLLVFALNWANNQIAGSRAERLVKAIKGYHQKHQKYPDKLDDLTPEFIAGVPLAKYTLMSRSFQYLSSPRSHMLVYVVFPPFGRAVYNVEREKWGSLD